MKLKIKPYYYSSFIHYRRKKKGCHCGSHQCDHDTETNIIYTDNQFSPIVRTLFKLKQGRFFENYKTKIYFETPSNSESVLSIDELDNFFPNYIIDLISEYNNNLSCLGTQILKIIKPSELNGLYNYLFKQKYDECDIKEILNLINHPCMINCGGKMFMNNICSGKYYLLPFNENGLYDPCNLIIGNEFKSPCNIVIKPFIEYNKIKTSRKTIEMELKEISYKYSNDFETSYNRSYWKKTFSLCLIDLTNEVMKKQRTAKINQNKYINRSALNPTSKLNKRDDIDIIQDLKYIRNCKRENKCIESIKLNCRWKFMSYCNLYKSIIQTKEWIKEHHIHFKEFDPVFIKYYHEGNCIGNEWYRHKIT